LEPIENSTGHRLLAYFIPIDYVMQGMIADTGSEWKLFEQHKTIGMITDYIFHPSIFSILLLIKIDFPYILLAGAILSILVFGLLL